MKVYNPIPKISLFALAAAIGYLFLISGQARMADGGLSGDEMHVAEKFISAVPAASLFATLGLGLWRAHKAGSWLWFFLQLLVFPSAYIYTLLINRGERA